MRSIRFSAFVEDMRLDALPKGVREDVGRFVDAKGHHKFPHYGMVVKELLAKADPVNLKSARRHVRSLDVKKAQEAVLSATKRGEKYILVLNDRIIDGHHFLAKAERGRVTSSLNVLDLTPARFQFAAEGRQVRFAASGGVAQDRYRKSIREEDDQAARGHYSHSATAGAILGMALRRGKMSRKAAAAAGAAGGIAAQAAVRGATSGTKDQYGERSGAGKKVDSVPALAIGAGALLAGRRRLLKKAAGAGKAVGDAAKKARKGLVGAAADVAKSAIGFENREEVTTFAVKRIAQLLRSKRVQTGAALAGGIAAADVATSAAMPDGQQTRSEAAVHGLKKGALYGGALAIAEPMLHGALVKAGRRVKLSARGREVHFDETAPDWDVRDQRGRSARVFAPGAKPRERREKRWYERVDNIRKMAVVGAIAAATAGGLAGYRAGVKRGAASVTLPKAAGAKMPKSHTKPGYKTKKVTVVSQNKFRKAAGGDVAS